MKIGAILIVSGVVILTWCTIILLILFAIPRPSDSEALFAFIPAAAVGMIAAGVLMRRSN